MKKTILIIGIIFLLIGVSVVSSISNRVENEINYKKSLKSTNSLKEIISFETTVYTFGLWSGFEAWGPGDIYRSREWEGDSSFSGGTWTNDGKFLCCMYGNGTLYEVDPKTLEACAIGDGGVHLNSLSYDPEFEILYGASGDALYEIDIETGEQEFIGDFGIGDTIIGLASDINGVLYAWDVKFSGLSYLYTVNTETGEATPVGGMGKTLCYAQDGSFDYLTDTLYLAAYICTPEYGAYLCTVDKETGELEILNQMSEEYTVFVISYELNMMPPVTTISIDPIYSFSIDDCFTDNLLVTLNATDNSGVIDTFYRINDGEWETYESPFIISQYEEYKIEYYSYDYVGNIEEVKVFYYYPDNHPPNAPIITGPTSGKPAILYNFTLNAVDPDGDLVRFIINWGDNTSNTTYYTTSGTNFTDMHMWPIGTYILTVNAQDQYGAISDGTNFTITIKKNKSIQNTLYLRFLDHFPLLNHLLDIWRHVLV